MAERADGSQYFDLATLRNEEEFLRSRRLSAIQPEIVALIQEFRHDWPAKLTLEEIAQHYSTADAALVARIELALAGLSGKVLKPDDEARLRRFASAEGAGALKLVASR